MDTTAKGFTQDLPPKGGYRPINTERIPLRVALGGTRAIAACTLVTIFGHCLYFLEWKRIKRDEIEMRSAELALRPLLIAERDRSFLKQIKRNRAEEKELMKYFPGWVVGTFFGDPVYKTVREDDFIEPDHIEYYAHANPADKDYKALLTLTT